MSSYLTAWVIIPSDFGVKEKTTIDGKTVRRIIIILNFLVLLI